MKMASRLIDLTSKKNKMHVQHTFSSNKQKTNLHAFLSFPCRCFFTTSTLFCTTKTSNLLDSHYFYGGIVVCAYPMFMFAFIFHCGSFSLCWPLAFLIVSQPLWIFMSFFLQNSSFLFSITHSSSFSVIHVSVNIKNNVEKDTTLLLFFLSKSPGGHWRPCDFFPLHLGCHTCWLNYLTLVCLWCGRTVGRAVGARSRDYQIFSDR